MSMKKKLPLIVLILLSVICMAAALFACKPKEYTVTFDAAGGEMAQTSIVVEEGVALNLSSYIPVREGYTFGGWQDEKGGSAALVVINTDCVFTAVWTPAQSITAYYVNGEVYLTEEKTTDEEFTPAEYPSSLGEFFGWYTDEEMTERVGDSVTAQPGGTALYGFYAGESYVNSTFHTSNIGGEVVITGLKDSSISTVYLPSVCGTSTVRVDDNAFKQVTSLKKAYIGASVNLGVGVFAGSGVEEIFCQGETYSKANGALYDGTELVYLSASVAGDYAVTDGTTGIYSYAFAGNKNLTSVTIASSVNEVGARICADCADDLLIYLQAKESGGFSSVWNNSGYTGEGKYAYKYLTDGSEGGYTYTVRDGKAYIFEYNGEERDIVVPQSLGGYPVCGIGRRAFMGTDITSVVIPAGVEYVSSEAFASCAALTRVKFLGEHTTLGAGIFADCAMLSDVTLPSALTIIPSDAFTGCFSLEDILLPDTLIAIESYAFFMTGIKQITIPQSVTRIGASAFEGTLGEDPSLPIVFTIYSDGDFDWELIVGNGNYRLKYV